MQWASTPQAEKDGRQPDRLPCGAAVIYMSSSKPESVLSEPVWDKSIVGRGSVGRKGTLLTVTCSSVSMLLPTMPQALPPFSIMKCEQPLRSKYCQLPCIAFMPHTGSNNTGSHCCHPHQIFCHWHGYWYAKLSFLLSLSVLCKKCSVDVTPDK